MKYFAAINKRGFANTWEVAAFDSRANRDAFVEKHDGETNRNNNRTDCRAIKKSEIKDFVDRPKPFTGRYRAIDTVGREAWDNEVGDYVLTDPGLIGYVTVVGWESGTVPL